MLIEMKKLYTCKPQYIYGTHDWKIVNKIIAESFSNNLFFNRGMIGGNNQYFEKIVRNMIYHPNLPIEIVSDVQFELSQDSVLYCKAEKVPFIVALQSTINPFSSCVLSLCCKV